MAFKQIKQILLYSEMKLFVVKPIGLVLLSSWTGRSIEDLLLDHSLKDPASRILIGHIPQT